MSASVRADQCTSIQSAVHMRTTYVITEQNGTTYIQHKRNRTKQMNVPMFNVSCQKMRSAQPNKSRSYHPPQRFSLCVVLGHNERDRTKQNGTPCSCSIASRFDVPLQKPIRTTDEYRTNHNAGVHCRSRTRPSQHNVSIRRISVCCPRTTLALGNPSQIILR